MDLLIHSRKYGEKIILFDPQFSDFILSKSWTIVQRDTIFYAVTRIVTAVTRIRYMHTLLIDSPPNRIIDHRDGNGLNNQLSNLRFVTNSQNLMNRGATLRNKTGYKGVHIRKDTGKFEVKLKANGIRYKGGSFFTAIEAAKKYNELAVKYHGEFAFLNKI